MIELI